MGRAWRIEFEGALYHVMSRGNEGNDIFLNDRDRQGFLNAIGEFSERFDIQIFAYVLMRNHYHLLIRTQRPNLSKAMQWLGVTYTRRFNDTHERCGHLFQGRFKSIIVQNDAYLMQLSCYIHRNPLRAKIVNRLVDYRWSSFRSYAYGYNSPSWLSCDLVLSLFNNHRDRNKAYREKVQHYSNEDKLMREDLRHGIILGTKKFVEQIRKAYLPDSVHSEIPQQKSVAKEINPLYPLEKAAAILECDLKFLKQAPRVSSRDKENRDLLIYSAWKTGRLTNTQIGDLFGVTYSSVSHSVKSFKIKLESESKLERKFKKIYSLFKM
jgi:REP element-mobilizing transposase RayT